MKQYTVVMLAEVFVGIGGDGLKSGDCGGRGGGEELVIDGLLSFDERQYKQQ